MTRHLSPSQLAALRSRLMARGDALRRELDVALHEPSARQALGLPNRREETGDEAVADLQVTLDIAAIERDTEELVQVTEALDRISQESYGRCIDCGGDIAWPRLNAQPHARRCLACEAQRERRHPVPTPGL